MKLKFTKRQMTKGIEIKLAGCIGDPVDKKPGTALYIEYYEGKVQVHVWNGEADCQTTILKQH